jgi:hypothetical protein
MAKKMIQQEEDPFHHQIGLKFKELVKFCIWIISLYCAKTWIFQKVDQKYPERFKMWCCKRRKKIS